MLPLVTYQPWARRKNTAKESDATSSRLSHLCGNGGALIGEHCRSTTSNRRRVLPWHRSTRVSKPSDLDVTLHKKDASLVW